MASSGTITKSITSAIKYVLEWDVIDTDLSMKRSQVRVRAYLHSTGGGSISSSASKSINIKIGADWIDNSSVTIGLSSGQKKLLFTTNTWLSHRSDGTIANQTISSTLTLGVTLSGTYYSSVTASGSVSIDALPVGATFIGPAANSRYNFFDLDKGTVTIPVQINVQASGSNRLRIFVEDNSSALTLVKEVSGLTSSINNISFTQTELQAIINKRQTGNGYLWLYLDTISGSTTVHTETRRLVVEIPNRSTIALGGDAGPYDTATNYDFYGDNEAFPGEQPWYIEVQFVKGGTTLYTTNKNEVGLAKGQVKFNIPSALSGLFAAGATTATVTMKIYSYWKGPSGTWYLIRETPIEKEVIINKRANPPTWNSNFEVREGESNVIGLFGSNNTGVFVRTKSRLQVIIPPLAASAVSPATMYQYKIYFNDVLLATYPYTSSEIAHTNPSFITTTSGLVRVDAIDSNGEIASLSKTIYITNHNAPNPTGTEVRRQNGYLGNFLTTVQANVSSVKVSGNEYNGVKALAIRIKKSTESDSAYTLQTNPSVASVSSTGTMYNQINYTGFTQEDAYVMKISITDEFNTTTDTLYEIKIGTPLVFFDKQRGSIGFGQFPTTTSTIETPFKIKAGNGIDVTGASAITGTLTVSSQLHSSYGVSSQYELWSKNGQYWFIDSGKQLKFVTGTNRFEFSDFPIYRGTKKVWDESTLQVQYGSIMTSNEANTPKEISVTFPTAFSSVPTVQLTVAVSAAQNINEATAYNVSTTGFTIYFSRITAVSSPSNEIKWLAIAKN